MTFALHEPFAAAKFIKEIGRGKDGARSMSRTDAATLYGAMLDGRVPDLELGAILLSMRIKGESIEEIAGFLDAASVHMLRLPCNMLRRFAPVVIPSYNGARKKANLTPLLALLLAKRGVPVLVHGVMHDVGRVSTAEIFEAMQLPFAQNAEQVLQNMNQHLPAFMPIDVLSPAMSRLLEMRRRLGVRNSTHTLVKLLQPFQSAALRLTSYTHPEYHAMLQNYFGNLAPHERGDVFLMRGTEGETVANTGRAQQIDWFHHGDCTTLVHTQQNVFGTLPDTPETSDAASTAGWINSVLSGDVPVPPNIAEQVEHCVMVSKLIRDKTPVV